MHSYQIPDLLHYLDDFITAGPPESSQCAHNLSAAIAVCRRLGLPLHPGKCVGPSTVLVVLGIELDSVNQVARLPPEKLSALHELITSWLTRRCFGMFSSPFKRLFNLLLFLCTVPIFALGTFPLRDDCSYVELSF